MSFQLVSPSDLNDRSKTMIEFEAQYDGKPLVCSISRRVLEQLGKRDGAASTEELLALFEEHRPVIAAMVRRKYEVGVVDFVGKVVVTTADLNRQPVVRLS